MTPIWSLLMACLGPAGSPAPEPRHTAELSISLPASVGDSGADETETDTALAYADYPVWIEGTERRFTTIQNALWGAEDGDRIWVEPGTYPETIRFLGKEVELASTGGAAVTVIDGERRGSVVSLRWHEGADTVLAGFTLTGGQGDERHGGGVFLEWSDATVKHCDITGNEADIGGGVYMRYGGAQVHNNIIHDNTANQGGGGITCSACWGAFWFNTLYDNHSVDGPVAEYNWGTADLVGNLMVEDEDETGPALRWLDPREDRSFTSDANGLWPEMVWTTVDGWPDGAWLISDPMLSDPEAGDFSLQSKSPAIDAGPPDMLDVDGSAADLGAYGGEDPFPAP